MVSVGKVLVRVGERRVRMFMAVPDAPGDRLRMLVLMMLVVSVPVVVRQGRVGVLVVMPFRQVRPHSDRHEEGGDNERNRERCAEG